MCVCVHWLDVVMGVCVLCSEAVFVSCMDMYVCVCEAVYEFGV